MRCDETVFEVCVCELAVVYGAGIEKSFYGMILLFRYMLEMLEPR